jgi:hypothetical protein
VDKLLCLIRKTDPCLLGVIFTNQFVLRIWFRTGVGLREIPDIIEPAHLYLITSTIYKVSNTYCIAHYSVGPLRPILATRLQLQIQSGTGTGIAPPRAAPTVPAASQVGLVVAKLQYIARYIIHSGQI